MAKKFVRTTKEVWDNKNDKSQYNNSIVFIEDTEQIWSNDIYYGGNHQLIETTYNELKNLRDNSQLVPGQQYRITDYVTTTIQENTQSANNQFDIIVTADSENVLNENARSANHENVYNIPNSVINDLPEEDDPYIYNYFGIVKYKGKEYFGYIGRLNDNDFDAGKSFDEIISDIQEWGILFELDTNFTNLNQGEYLDFSYITWQGMTEYLTKDEFINHINYNTGYENLVIYDDTMLSVNLDYFSNSNLAAWEIKYCLDNDTTRFAWADAENGKGVIYYMKDEYGNECPYDFKNIQFVRTSEWFSEHEDWCNNVIGNVPNQNHYYYTFTYVDEQKNIYDASIIGNTLHNDEGYISGVYDNVIKEYYNYSLFILPNNIFYSTGTDGEYYGCYSNSFGTNCYSNTFGKECLLNTFGNNCHSNILGYRCISNTFGNVCESNTLGYGCSANIFGHGCVSNTLDYGCFSNTFNYGCFSNTFGNSCYSNAFGEGCKFNTFGNSCGGNTFGNNCDSNTFEGGCESNIFGNLCQLNTFGNECFLNTFGNNCNSNTFGNDCTSNTFGNDCNYNIFEGSCNSNTFGGQCIGNEFMSDCHSNTFGNECDYNTFGESCYFNTFMDSCTENEFGEECEGNTFETNCYGNTFGYQCVGNTFGISCNYNTFGDGCITNTFEINCYYNTFGIQCYNNTFGTQCKNILFGNECGSNTFGNDNGSVIIGSNNYNNIIFRNYCCGNIIGNECNHIILGNECYNNIFENFNRYISFQSDTNDIDYINIDYSNVLDYCCYNKIDAGCYDVEIINTSSAPLSSTNMLKHIHITRGVTGLQIDVPVGCEYETKVAKKSNGKIVIYNEADLIADQN